MTGTVSLQAGLKGINMGRIMRSFYEHEDEVFTFEVLRKLLLKYQRKIDSFDARIRLAFPIRCCNPACGADWRAGSTIASRSRPRWIATEIPPRDRV